eukprot:TRINITY_DN7980_c0_g1_i1.p2 TRINITY_DN7980_c0_g1~~TRINITY_DN7980_c0_g1_i1.p2  ORF type:complete len:192 (-),score=98.47 TRINITY_DN7980_c0_g1_i1:183-719(-)
MAYHSSFNDPKDVTPQQICGLFVLPIKTKQRGPAPVQTSADDDVLDEAVSLFRANVLFRNYEIKGPADRLLIYLTLYIHQCLIRIQNKDKDSALKTLQALAIENFAVPGDAKFVLGGFIPTPSNRSEIDSCRQWWTQLRIEIGIRLCEQVFKHDTKVPSKHWMMFTKRKFLNKSLEGN